MVKLSGRCFSYFPTGLAQYRASVCINAYRITVNDWRLLCQRKIIDQLHNSESHTVNLHHCDSIMEGYQHSVSKYSAFESHLLENYSSFILTIDSHSQGHYQGIIRARLQRNSGKCTFFPHMSVLSFIFNKKFVLYIEKLLFQHDYSFMTFL